MPCFAGSYTASLGRRAGVLASGGRLLMRTSLGACRDAGHGCGVPLRPDGPRHGTRGAARTRGARCLPELVLDHLVGHGVVDKLTVGDEGLDQAGVTHVIELARQAAGEGVDQAEGGLGKERAGSARLPEVVLDVAGALLRGEGGQVGAETDALGDGGEALQLQRATQFRLPGEDERERRAGIHVEVEEKAHFLQHGASQQMRLVDDDDRLLAGVVAVLQSPVQLPPGVAAVEAWGQAELAEHLVVEVARGELGVGHIERGIAGDGESRQEGAERGGFAGADVPGEHGKAACPCGVVQPPSDLLHGRGAQQLVGRQAAGKGRAGQVKKGFIHRGAPPGCGSECRPALCAGAPPCASGRPGSASGLGWPTPDRHLTRAA